MEHALSLPVAFTLGLFSTVHCLGMCGGIVGALTLALPAQVRATRSTLALYALAYNLGRIGSYTLAGAVIGGAANAAVRGALPDSGHTVLAVLAALALACTGLYLAGWLPAFQRIEAIGVRLWQTLRPLFRHLLPVRSPWRALGAGALWGLLPCGLVYSALAWSAAAGGPGQSALSMLAFGLGTLPGMVAAGTLAGVGSTLLRPLRLRQIAGVLLVALAMASTAVSLQPTDHTLHTTHRHSPR